MNRRLALLGLVAAIAGISSLAGAGAARADESLAPYCQVRAYDPFTDYDNYVKGPADIVCSAGSSGWAAQWDLEVCLEKWVRPDDQFYPAGTCDRVYAWGDNRRVSGAARAEGSCNATGYGEYRTVVHARWFSDYWHDDWLFSDIRWNCVG